MPSEMIPLSEVQRAIRDGDDATHKRTMEHMGRNMTQAIAPLQSKVDEHDRFLRGDGSDSNLGLVTQSRLNTQRLTNMEHAQNRLESSLSDKLDSLTDDIRALMGTGRTPRNGTQVTIGTREGDDSDHEVKRQKPPWLDNTTTRNILILIAAVSGGAGLQFGLKQVDSQPEQAVQVQAEAVAEKKDELVEKQAELDRRERELRERESRSGRRWQQAPEPAGTGGSP